METFFGTPAHPGVAIAAAAVLHAEFGESTLAPERLHQIGERMRRFGVQNPESEQVVLVADAVPAGYWLSPIPGLEIVGVAAAGDALLTPAPDRPAVTGLGEDLLTHIQEGDILIVDGDRGRVYAAPDASTVARYQAPQTVARRVFIDSAHLPARTVSDSRIVSVIACAPTLAEIAQAMAQGADGVLIPAGNDFLGGVDLTQTAGEQLAILSEVAQTTGGKPLFLSIPSKRLALSALSRAASACSLHLALADPAEIAEIQSRIAEIEMALEEEDALFGTVRFEGLVSAIDEDAFLPETLDGYAGILTVDPIADARMERLLLIAGLAHHAGKPAALALPESGWTPWLGDALELGFARLIVPPATVLAVKDAIRAS